MSETTSDIKTKTLSARTDFQDAFLLHKHPYRESSLVLDVFTRAHGRIALMAKGAKRANSALRPVLADFQPLSLSWKGVGELPTLTHAEWRYGLWRLSGAAVMMGYYINELIITFLVRDDPHPRLFDSYQATLAQLSDTADASSLVRVSDNEEQLNFQASVPSNDEFGSTPASASPAKKNNGSALLRQFEWKLLCEMGYGFDLSKTAEGTAVEPDAYYRVDPTLGIVETSAQSKQPSDDQQQYEAEQGDYLAPPAEQLLPHLIKGSALLALDKGLFPSSEILNTLRELLRHLLLFHNDQKPFLTRQVLHDLQS